MAKALEQLLLDLLQQAVSSIPAAYFSQEGLRRARFGRMQVTEGASAQFDRFFKQQDERVFAYELYHQLRLRLNQLDAGVFGGIHLQGEVRKREIPEVIAELEGLTRLKKEYIPDLLFHSSVGAEAQVAVIEIKADPDARGSQFRADIAKIEEFISRYKYQVGALVIANVELACIKRVFKNRHFCNFQRTLRHANQIHVIVRSSPQYQASRFCVAGCQDL